MPSLFRALRLWAGKPIRWVPPLLSLTFIFWLLGPRLFHVGLPPPHRLHNGLPPPIGHPHRPPNRVPLGSDTENLVWPKRANEVRRAFIHAYEGYRANAFKADELLPVSGKKVDNFNGWGVTIYDALDTMWIMGFDDYFNEAVEIIAQADFVIPPSDYVPFFETIIRYLGGLLSAYSLSGKSVLLEKADELGGLLLPAFGTKSGLPMFAINPQNKRVRGGWTGATLWAEAMSNQMEYKYLAHLTGKREYFDKAEHVMQIMYDSNITDGLFPTMWDTLTAEPSNAQFSVGAFADSAHEYLLKQWLLTGRSETKIRDLYLQVTHAIIHNLLYLPPDRDFLYVTDTRFTPSNKSHPHVPSHTFEHLSCFLPGLLALGTVTLKESEFPSADERELHLWAAEGLAYACWLSYADQKTGLGPDEMTVSSWPETDSGTKKGLWVDLVDEWKKDGKPLRRPPGLREVPPEDRSDRREYMNRKHTYLLRPETVESFYILWRTTGDERWRERGWAVFQSIERYAKTEYGYASINEVDSDAPTLKDEMPSYFMAETLKYLYLLFTDEEIIPLDKWVFNTEAHPLPIFEWTAEEKAAYKIS
ncbi:glycoside hydrolase family 47 protein [Moniliophthora roreri MCA 2997]|uniref:alpha-1,2-Mannosidase n=1 Tax=Moniliophthora roreri (strain MCA 2997) TaxID=1381753 RepID=V2XCD2_MONRO|nr:glycoside hydrolase family 47 protein [Moniliophthora roreri MCA 2997]